MPYDRKTAKLPAKECVYRIEGFCCIDRLKCFAETLDDCPDSKPTEPQDIYDTKEESEQ